MNKVTVLGAGAWGTAVATLLAENGFQVVLWTHEADVAQAITTSRINHTYLPGVILPESISATTHLQEALSQSLWVFEAIPVKYMRNVLAAAKDYYNEQQAWVILSKGIEQHALMLPSQIIDDVFKSNVKKAVFSGPSFAQDLAQRQITAVTIAASDCVIGGSLQKMLANSYFRPYISLDIIGAQVGGAVKNILALGLGMLEGAGWADNAKAYLLTRGLHEMALLAQELGGKQETIYGLSGVGDLLLTTTGKLSKNLALGRRLGQGQALDSISGEGGLPEGINTLQSIAQLIEQTKLTLPICQGIYQVIYEQKKLDQFLNELMARPLEQECAI